MPVGKYQANHLEAPGHPVFSLVMLGVAIALLLIYAGLLFRAHGWTKLVRNYLIAAAVLLGIVGLYAFDRL